MASLVDFLGNVTCFFLPYHLQTRSAGTLECKQALNVEARVVLLARSLRHCALRPLQQSAVSWPRQGRAAGIRTRALAAPSQATANHLLKDYPAAGDLEGLSVVVVGLGISGRAAAALALLRGAASVTGIDRKTEIKRLEDDPHVWDCSADPNSSEAARRRLRTSLGTEDLGAIHSASVVVVSPGVPLSERHVALALELGLPVLSELAFSFSCLPPSLPLAAVSGTNGKSTVATFCGQLLRAQGWRPFVGGNLGTPLAQAAALFVRQARGVAGPRAPGIGPQELPQVAVVEVSSYQMELPGDFRPKAAAILNLTPDHLERHGSLEAYGAAKCRMFARMGPGDTAAIPWGDALLSRLLEESGTAAERAWLGAQPGAVVSLQRPQRDLQKAAVDHASATASICVPGPASGPSSPAASLDLSSMTALGPHNRENAAAAALLCLALRLPGFSCAGIQEALPALRPPPHRMEIVHTDASGVRWINDSKATNVESAIVGVAALSQGGARAGGGSRAREADGAAGGAQVAPSPGAVVLLGGIAKAGQAGEGLGFHKLVDPLNRQRAVITFGQSGPTIAHELRSSGLLVALVEESTLQDAVKRARELAPPGCDVLLSPACASFDEFQNFEHRGLVFAQLCRMDS